MGLNEATRFRDSLPAVVIGRMALKMVCPSRTQKGSVMARQGGAGSVRAGVAGGDGGCVYACMEVQQA